MRVLVLFFVVYFLTFVKCDENDENVEEEEVFDDEEFLAPVPEGKYWFFDNFQDGDLKNWFSSEFMVENEDGDLVKKYNGEVEAHSAVGTIISHEDDIGMILPEQARHYGVLAAFKNPVDNTDSALVVQYELKFENTLECGGAYLKLPYQFELDKIENSQFNDKTGRKNPITKEFEEKHLQSPPVIKNDKFTHLYTLVLRPDDTYEVFIDMKSAKAGSLLEDFEPPFNPPEVIDDPEDFKPEDWVDEEFIDDPTASKPEDWDEDAEEFIDDPDDEKPEGWEDDADDFIEDPDAEKPEEWDDEEDGEWAAPMIPNPVCQEIGCGEWKPATIQNPEYKGKWYAPKIDNPDWIGEWNPKQIANPGFFVEKTPYLFEKIGGIIIEVWQMTENILFDNIYVGGDEEAAFEFAEKSFVVKREREKAKAPVEETKLLDSGESFLEQVQELFENVPLPVVIGVAVVIVLMFLLLCFCRRSPKEDEEEEEEGEKEEEKEEKGDVENEIKEKEGETESKETEVVETVEEKEGEEPELRKKEKKKKKKKKKAQLADY